MRQLSRRQTKLWALEPVQHSSWAVKKPPSLRSAAFTLVIDSGCPSIPPGRAGGMKNFLETFYPPCAGSS